MHSKFRGFYPLPNFLFGVDRSQIWAHDREWPKGSPVQIRGWSPPGNMSYEFPKFSIISQWEKWRWRQSCWLSGVRGSCEKFYKGENFSIFGSGVKNAFQTIFHTWAILAMIPPSQGGTKAKIAKVCFIKFPALWLFLQWKWWNFTLWGDPAKIRFIKFPNTWLSSPQYPPPSRMHRTLWPCIGMHWWDPSQEIYKKGPFSALAVSWAPALEECSVQTSDEI